VCQCPAQAQLQQIQTQLDRQVNLTKASNEAFAVAIAELMTGNAATRAASETATQVANATRDIAIAAAATANNTAAVAYNALDTAEEAKVAADRATDVTRSVNF